MKIAIDIDGVIVDSFPKVLEKINEAYGLNLNLDDFRAYGLDEVTGIPWQEIMKFNNNLFLDPSWHLSLKPVSGAISAIKKLAKAGFKIHFVSDREPPMAGLTQKWMQKYGIENYWEEVHYNPDNIRFVDFKIQKFSRLQSQVIVEDAAHHIDLFVEKAKIFLLDKPWNQYFDHPKVKRVSSWKEITEDLIRK